MIKAYAVLLPFVIFCGLFHAGEETPTQAEKPFYQDDLRGFSIASSGITETREQKPEGVTAAVFQSAINPESKAGFSSVSILVDFYNSTIHKEKMRAFESNGKPQIQIALDVSGCPALLHEYNAEIHGRKIRAIYLSVIGKAQTYTVRAIVPENLLETHGPIVRKALGSFRLIKEKKEEGDPGAGKSAEKVVTGVYTNPELGFTCNAPDFPEPTSGESQMVIQMHGRTLDMPSITSVLLHNNPSKIVDFMRERISELNAKNLRVKSREEVKVQGHEGSAINYVGDSEKLALSGAEAVLDLYKNNLKLQFGTVLLGNDVRKMNKIRPLITLPKIEFVGEKPAEPLNQKEDKTVSEDGDGQ